jgi:hypothetical protein
VLAILFGLSMDYQVFLVSRMAEEWSRTHDNARSVLVGQTQTARVITAAAAIMIAVFITFVLMGQADIAEFGIALAAAVTLDAFAPGHRAARAGAVRPRALVRPRLARLTERITSCPRTRMSPLRRLFGGHRAAARGSASRCCMSSRSANWQARSIPSWAVIGTADHAIPPAAQEFMAGGKRCSPPGPRT